MIPDEELLALAEKAGGEIGIESLPGSVTDDHLGAALSGHADHGGAKVRAPKKPKPARGEAWGILNPFGDLWTYETFNTPEAATAYVAAFWRNIQGGGDLRRFRPVRVKITVTAIPDTSREIDRTREDPLKPSPTKDGAAG